jgi:hypothetical protein
MQNRKITTSELDFDQIKTNLKEFLKGQNEFQDYDFEGSALSVLLDVLAYNTHYNALYNNLAVNESFLDSASKRSSVVSLAKNLGYIPKSATSATAVVDVIVRNTATTPITLTLPKYSQFNTQVDGTTYTFYNMGEVTTTVNGNVYTFSNLEIKQGTPLTFKYEVTPSTKYIIPNINVDLSTLSVRVQESSSSGEFETFTRAERVVSLNSTSAVYFIKEIEGQLYEVYFGDGSIGKSLQNGNIVTFEYMVTDRDIPNGARLFSYQGSSLLGGSVIIETRAVASGGADQEDIESIRYNAPKVFSAQDRAVTVDDYKTLIATNFNNAESINVWGGEDHDVPTYGKVFITIKPKTSARLNESEKSIVKSLLKEKNVVSITPEVLDPEYTNIEVSSSIYYSPRLTNKTASELQSMVIDTIKNYNTTDLEKFDSIFRHSKISRLIDLTEPSIIGNVTTIKLHKELTPAYNVISDYTINLINPIYSEGAAEESVLSTGFYIPDDSNVYYIDDDGMGNLRMFFFVSATIKTIVRNNIGTVDYQRGIIKIPSLNIVAIADNTFKFIIKPSSYDAISARQSLVSIPDNLITVNAIVDKISSGDSAGGANHIFTSSRS